MRRFTTSTLWLSLLLAVLIVGCRRSEPEPELVEASDMTELTLPLDSTGLALDSYRGTITVTGTRDSTASLRFEKHARAATPDSAQLLLDGISVEEAGATRSGAQRVRVRSDHEEHTRVDVIVEMPYRSALVLEATNGDVEVATLAAPMEIELANGSVTVRGAADDVDIDINNGNIDVAMEGFPEDTDVWLDTGNGNITLQVPGTVSARVDLEAQVGEVMVEGLDITTQMEQATGAGTTLIGEVGGASGEIRLRTQNGSITLRSQ